MRFTYNSDILLINGSSIIIKYQRKYDYARLCIANGKLGKRSVRTILFCNYWYNLKRL